MPEKPQLSGHCLFHPSGCLTIPDHLSFEPTISALPHIKIPDTRKHVGDQITNILNLLPLVALASGFIEEMFGLSNNHPAQQQQTDQVGNRHQPVHHI